MLQHSSVRPLVGCASRRCAAHHGLGRPGVCGRMSSRPACASVACTTWSRCSRARGSYVWLSPEEAHVLSPFRHAERVRCPVIMNYACHESPEFVRHDRAFAAALSDAGRPVELLVDEEANRFEIIESLGHPGDLPGRAALAQIAALDVGRGTYGP